MRKKARSIVAAEIGSEFLLSASGPEQFPREDYPEIAFLGRSNVGKSSLINALAGRKGLAYTSNKPGCTQAINFYRVGEFCFADLPGYGFARVPERMRRGWRTLIENYLNNRRGLALSIVVLDARRGWMETDLDLKEWLDANHRSYLVAAAKVDKLNQSEKQQCASAMSTGAADLVLYSAKTGWGVRDIWQAIKKTRRSP